MSRKPMKKKSRQSKKRSAMRRQAGYVMGASLLAAGLRAQAADTLTPEQAFEGGTNSYNNWIELSAGGLITDGNKAGAEQRDSLNQTGAFGGISDLHYQTDVAKKTHFTLDGHSIFDNHDYAIGMKLEREGLGFIRVNAENFRTWDANNGGYDPVSGMAYPNQGDALALDRGKISLEAGWAQEGKPHVTFKYTHAYRNGDEGTTLWGQAPAPASSSQRLYPGILNIDEKSDTFQLDVTKRIKSTDVGLGIRFESGDLNDAHLLSSAADQKITDQQDTSYDMFSAHGSTETWLKKNLFLSTGFMFVNLDNTFSGNRVYGDDFDVVYSPAYPANYYGYYNLTGGSHEHEYVVNVNLLSLPTKTFTITPSLRIQKDDWNAHSSENVFDPGGGLDPNAFNNTSGLDSLDVCEQVEARYTGFTNWVCTASAQWTEGQGSLDEAGGITQLPGAPDGQLPVLFRTDDSRFFQKYGLNARWYPFQRASLDLGGYYKQNEYDYANVYDSTSPANVGVGLPAYPDFLVYQGFKTWDGSVRLTLHPFSRVSLASRYEYQLSSIDTQPGASSGLGEVDASRMSSHIVGQNIGWTPLNWLSLQAGINYVFSETKTPASEVTQAILNSQNNYWTVNFNAGFVLDDKTDLNVGYYFYHAADGQNDIGSNGLPLGTDAQEHSINAILTRRITKNLRWSLKYAFTHYQDFASGGAYNFDAHLLLTSIQYRF